MKKARVLVALMISALAFSAVVTTSAAAKPKKKKIRTAVSTKFVNPPGPADDPDYPYDDYDDYYGPSNSFANALFKGKVKSRKSFCVRKRKVLVKSKPDGEKIGSDLTNRKGKFRVNAASAEEGRYKVKVKRKVRTKKRPNGKRVKQICKPAKGTVRVVG
jgi:hypothetical protein